MDSPILLAIAALVVYLVMAICGLIPVCTVVKSKHKQQSSGNFSRGTERIISFCNCCASGVFIAMCFLGLLPYAQDKTRRVLEELEVRTDFPLAEFTCMLGFFLIMTVEQVVIRCQDSRQHSCQATQVDDLHHPRPSNYYKTVHDESATEQLLAKSAMEGASPESPSTLKDLDLRVYQNVPMVTFKDQELGEEITTSTHKKSRSTSRLGVNKCNHQIHVEKLIQQGLPTSGDAKKKNPLRLAILFLAISIHSVFEGMALGLQTDKMRIFHLLVAVLFHEALVAFSVGITMARLQLTLHQGVKYILLFSTAVPIGIVLGLVVQQAPGSGGSVASALFQSLAAGIFIHVTFLELVPAELSNSEDRLAKVAFLFLGFVALALVTITMGSHH